MPEEIFVGKEEGVELYALRCEKCDATLAHIFRSAASYQFYVGPSCPHYKWIDFGNECWSRLPCRKCELGYDPTECNEIYRKKVKVYYDGTTVWVLIPK